MFKNYITVAVRNLLRQKRYAFINIFGLALGIACCLLMALFVKHEWSYDRFHEHKDRIYRLLAREVKPSGEVQLRSLHPLSIVEPLSETFPGIAHASGFMQSDTRISGGSQTSPERIGEVNADFLKMFTFPLLAGDPKTALSRPDGVVIDAPMAERFFGKIQPDYENVLGQTLTFHGQEDEQFVVTGIMQSVPDNSSLRFNCLIPISHYKNYGMNVNGDSFTSVYVQLAENQNVDALEAVLPAFVKTHQVHHIETLLKHKIIADSADGYALYLQPLTDIYWHSPAMNAYEERGNPFAAYLLSGIAVLVLLIACSNFMTLSIGRSTGRAREVGIRKVVGAHRRQLMQQFWGEAVLLSFLSLGLGIAMAELFLPVFNELVQKHLHLSYLNDGLFLLITVAIMLAVGLLAGSYPAVVLSRFQPVNSLKGQTRIGGRSKVTRILVVLQYAASVALMVCTGVIIEQQHYMQTKDLGFDREHMVVVRVPGMDSDVNNLIQIAKRYEQALSSYSQIVSTSICDRSLTSGSANTRYTTSDGSRIRVRVQRIDADYIKTMKLTLLGGRNFSPAHATDSTQAVLVNEALIRATGLKVGQPLSGLKLDKMKDPVIIGVVRDFNTGPLYEHIPPLIMQTAFNWGAPTIMIRIRPNDVPGTLSFLEKIWKNVVPDRAIELSFLDDNLNHQYRNEQRWQRVLGYSTGFAIAISCLGLFGLASLAVTRRTREIGIRKVLGASVPNLINLLSRDFAKLLILSNIVAWPIAYWAMDKWLANFAYHTGLSPGVFILSGALALTVALLTVGLQTLKAAHANPVDALRNE